jgi:hypothetical protein
MGGSTTRFLAFQGMLASKRLFSPQNLKLKTALESELEGCSPKVEEEENYLIGFLITGQRWLLDG